MAAQPYDPHPYEEEPLRIPVIPDWRYFMDDLLGKARRQSKKKVMRPWVKARGRRGI